MRLRNILVLFMMLPFFAAQNAISSDLEFIPIGELRQEIDQFARDHFINIYSSKKIDENLRVTVSNLDRRLRLARCDEALTYEINSPAHMASNVTVKTTCQGANRWSIYVPVTVDVFGDIVVATRPLQRGTVIEASDLTYQTINIARYGAGQLQDIERAVGLELTRRVNAGESIKVSHTRAPRVIQKGDSVVLEARGSAISVAVNGEALESGHVGKQIRVRNTESKRVVDGIVSGPGKVSIKI